MKTLKRVFTALAALCCFGTVMAATPIAVWDGTNTDLGNFTLTAQNSNTIQDNVISIADGATGGVVYTGSNSSLNNSTFIIRGSGLNLANANSQYLLSLHQNILGGGNGDASYNKVGVSLAANNASVRGIWDNGFYGNDNADVAKPFSTGTDIVINVQTSGGVFVYEIVTDASTGARTLEQRYINYNLKASNTNYKGFSLGGIYEKSSSTLVSATGWTISKLAVFGSTLSENEILGYAFPSDLLEITATAEGATIGASDSGKNINVTGAANGVLNIVGKPSVVKITTSGESFIIKPATGAMIDANAIDASAAAITIDVSEYDVSTLALNAVQGAPYRVWPVKCPSITGNVMIDDTTIGKAPAGYTCSVIQTAYGPALEFTSALQYGSLNVNFDSAVDSDATLHGAFQVAGSSWNNVVAENAENVAVAKYVGTDGIALTDGGAKITLTQVKNRWDTGDSNSAKILYGYCDDGESPKAVITGIPFEKYRVIAYAATDTGNTTFCPKKVNGVWYSTGGAGSAATPTIPSAKIAWGSSNSRSSLVEGVNYLVSEVLTGDSVTIENPKTSDGRACLPAVQIVEVGVALSAETVEAGGTLVLSNPQTEPLNIRCNGSFTVTGTSEYTVTAADVSRLVLDEVTGTVTLGNYTCYALGADRALPGGKIMFGEGSAVAITETTEEYGKGIFSVSELTGVSNVILTRVAGNTETITVTDGTASRTVGVVVSGLATWCDYEMEYESGNVNKTGFENTGKDIVALNPDSSIEGADAFYNNMLYTYAHPWRNISYPDNWTAVVRCTVPNLSNAAVIMFGTYASGAIGLIAGSNPETEMLLVSTPGAVTEADDKHFTTLATMNVKDATTAQHVYVFTKDGTTVNVYCDGENVLKDYELDSATLGGGLQVGSLHGGVVQNSVHTGIVRFGKGEDQISSLSLAEQQNARIDCVRMYDYIISGAQVDALSVEFPAVKLYRATASEDADTTWSELTWSPAWDGGNDQSKAILTTEGDATVALPETITVDEVQLDLAEGSTLTLSGPGSLTITQPVTTGKGTLKLTGTVTLTRNTAFSGSVVFEEFAKEGNGNIVLSNGATIGVDEALVVTPLGNYTLAGDTVVDSAYTGDGVQLMPLTSAVVSITQNSTTLYYSDLDTALATLMTIGNVSDDVSCVLLNGTTWPTTPQDYAGMMRTLGYYVDSDGTLTKAVARITSTPYKTLAAAVDAATDGATVTLLLASSEAITLNDKAITLSETANFSGTLTGNGTLTFAAFRNNPSITFTDWTGTVVLPEFAANGTILNSYGVTGSTVVLKGITSGWLGETSNGKMDVNPTLQLDGDVTIKGFSTGWDYTFSEITGEGTFALDPTDNNPKSATITKVAEGFTGMVASSINTALTIGTLDREAGTSTEPDTLLLSKGGTGEIVVGAVTIGGEPADVYLVYKDDGVYVGVPPVAAVYDGETLVGNFASLADAIDAAQEGQKVVLLAATDEDVTVDEVVVVEAGAYAITGTITVTADGATVTLLNEPVLGENTWILGRNTETGVITVGYGLTCQLTIVCSNSGVVTPTGVGVREVLAANTWEVRGGTEVTLTATPGTDYSGYQYRVDSGYYTVISDVEQHNLVFENNVATITVTADTQASVTFVVREQEFTIPEIEHLTVTSVYKWGDPTTVYTPVAGTYSITQGTSIVIRYTPEEGYMVTNPGGYVEQNIQVTAQTTTIDNASIATSVKRIVAMVGENPYDTLSSAISMAVGNPVTLVADTTENVSVYNALTLSANGRTITGTLTIQSTGSLNLVDEDAVLTVTGLEFGGPLSNGIICLNGTTLTIGEGADLEDADIWVTVANADAVAATLPEGFVLVPVENREDVVRLDRVEIGVNPEAITLNYNSYATLSVVGGSLEGATYGWTMYTNNVACSSLQGPVKISSGKNKATVKVYSETMAFDNVVAKVAITNGEEVIEREATITVADVAAKIGETEYTKAELNDAIAAAIEFGNVLEHYLSVSTTISKGQTLKTKKLAERNGSATVKAAASTVEGEAWTVAKSEEDGVITWSVATETPYFEFTSTDGQTVEYLASPKNASGVNKLLSDVTLTKQFSVTTDGVVLDLNGHALTSTYSSTTAGAIYVNVISPAPAALTVKDSVGGGSIAAASAHSVFTLGSNGQLTVEGGSFTGKHIVYGTKVTSLATITGGTFTATDAGYTLNMLDTARGTITVTGGTFTGFNPANNSAEGAGTNFVPNGYVSTETSTGVWTVAEVQEVPVTPGAQTEPVDTQEAAEAEAAKVVPSVPTAVAEELTPAQEAAYTEMFEAKVVPVTVGETTKYAVEVVMKESVAADLQTAVDGETADVATAAVAAAADPTTTPEAEVATTPGLYYVVEAGSSLDGIAPESCTLATGTSLKLKIPNKGTSGFYRIGVSVTPVDVQE